MNDLANPVLFSSASPDAIDSATASEPTPSLRKLSKLFDVEQTEADSQPYAVLLLWQTILVFVSALASAGSLTRFVGIFAAINICLQLHKLLAAMCRSPEKPAQLDAMPLGHLSNNFILGAGILVPSLLAGAYAVLQMPKTFNANPLGAIGELLMVISVPLSIAACWYAVSKRRLAYAALAGSAAGVALAISGVLTATWMFQPPLSPQWGSTTPFGFFVLWSPVAFLASCLALSSLLSTDNAKARALSSVWGLTSVVLASALITTPHLDEYNTDFKLKSAVIEGGADSDQAIDFLKNKIPAPQLVTLLSSTPDNRWGLGRLRFYDSLSSPAPYFLLTGKSMESLYTPAIYSDDSLGKQLVGEVISGLTLNSSNLEGSLNTDSLSGSLDWTMVFKNSGKNQSETRSDIKLPPGAVVSRVTAWINGKPVEASFDCAEKTTQAYQWVVQKHRDPILVTASGPDSVFVQAYPVPPYGGSLKLRIGIKTPLKFLGSDHAVVQLPKFTNKNFVAKASECVNLSSNSAFIAQETSGLTSEDSDNFHLRGRIASADKNYLFPEVSLTRPHHIDAIATYDENSHGKQYIVQTVVPQAVDRGRKLVFVIDTSSTLQPHIAALKQALSRLVDDDNVRLIFATKNANCEELLPELSIKEALKQIDSTKFAGGSNNESAVLQALQSAAANTNSTVVWLHGPQPLQPCFLQLDSLGIYNKPALVDLQLGSGKNELISSWNSNGLNSVTTYDHVVVEDPAASLQAAIGKCAHRQPSFAVCQKRVDKKPDMLFMQTSLASAELSSLWAARAIKDCLERGNTRAAAQIGAQYHVVSPVTGAVALEKNSDYAFNHLKRSPFKAGTARIQQDANFLASDPVSTAGTTNGTIGPEGADANIVTGVNTAGFVRENRLANAAALFTAATSLLAICGWIYSAIAILLCVRKYKISAKISSRLLVHALIAVAIAILITPANNLLFQCLMDANLFS